MTATLAFVGAGSREGLAEPPAAAGTRARLVEHRHAGAEACPDDAGIRARVAERLGFEPFADDAATTVEVTFSQSEGLLRASVVEIDAGGTRRGERTLDSSDNSCGALADAVALSIAVMLEPSPARTPETPPTRPSSAPPRNHDSADRKVAPRTTPSVLLSAYGGPLLSMGVAPALAIGFEAGVQLRAQNFQLGLEGRIDLPASAAVEGGGSARSSIMVGSLVPCFAPRVLRLCGLLSAGVLRAEGEGIPQARRATSFHAASGLRAGLEADLTERVFLGVHSDVVAHLTRTTLAVGPTDLWSTPVLSGTLAADLGIHFP